MKSAWIGIGFSHHNVPSLSKTATRSAAGTPADTVRSVNSSVVRCPAAGSATSNRPMVRKPSLSSGASGVGMPRSLRGELVPRVKYCDMPTTANGEVSFYYETFGADNDPVLLLVNGL